MFSKIKTFLGNSTVLKHWLLSYLLVLVIPIGGFIVISFTARAIITDEITKSHSETLATIQTSIDGQLRQLQQIASSLLLDQRFRDVLHRGNTWPEIIESQTDLIELLFNYYNTISGIDVLVYILELDYVITPVTAQGSQLLSQSIEFLGHAINEHEWRMLLSDIDNFGRFFPSQYLSYRRFGEDALVFYANFGLLSGFRNYHITNVFVSLQHSTIDSIFEVSEDITLLILDSYGDIVMHFGTWDEYADNFNVIWADTTYMHSNVVKIDDISYIFTTRESTVGNFEYVMLMPYGFYWRSYHNIVFIATVYMVVSLLVGLITALFLIKSNYNPVRSVLSHFRSDDGKISGNEFEIIRAHLVMLDESRSSMESSLGTQQKLLRENYLHSMLIDGKCYLSDDDILETLSLDLESKIFQMICVFAINTKDSLLTFVEGKSDKARRMSLAFLVGNVLDELLENKFEYLSAETDSAIAFAFLCDKNELADFESVFESVSNKLCEVFIEHFGLELNLVWGYPVENMDELYFVYRSILAEHANQRTTPEIRVVRTTQLEEHMRRFAPAFDEYSSLLCEAVQHKVTLDATNILDMLFMELDADGEPFPYVRFRIFAIVDKLCSIVSSSKDFQQSPAVYTTLISLTDSSNQVELKQSLSNLISLLCNEDADGKKGTYGLSTRIEAYINENYADKNLNITMIADHMGLSAKYISKVYKLQAGQGLLNYINCIRINKAKEIITRGYVTINDVSEHVGYTNQRTFRRAFRKLEGINPSEYNFR